MKTFLITLCVLSLLKSLQAAPQPELTEGVYTNETPKCEVDFNKLESDIDSVKKILEERLNEIVTETPNTDANIKQLKSEIDSLTKVVTNLLGSSSNENLEDLIKSNNQFIDDKILAFEVDVKELMKNFEEQKSKTKITNVKHEEMLTEISTKVEETLQKLTVEQHKVTQSTENTPDMLKKFEEFGEHISQLLSTKFEQQENELKTLKAQNAEYLAQLKELSVRLEEKMPSYKEHTEQIEKVLSEKHVGLTNHMENLNATLVQHFGTHVEKLNAHESSFTDIKAAIGNLENKFGTECAKIDTNKETLDTLVTRFDKAETFWKKLENYAGPQQTCNQLPENIDLIIQLDD